METRPCVPTFYMQRGWYAPFHPPCILISLSMFLSAYGRVFVDVPRRSSLEIQAGTDSTGDNDIDTSR